MSGRKEYISTTDSGKFLKNEMDIFLEILENFSGFFFGNHIKLWNWQKQVIIK